MTSASPCRSPNKALPRRPRSQFLIIASFPHAAPLNASVRQQRDCAGKAEMSSTEDAYISESLGKNYVTRKEVPVQWS